jgi:hypothetical protein
MPCSTPAWPALPHSRPATCTKTPERVYGIDRNRCTDSLGILSRVCARLAGAVLVQRPSLLRSRPRAVLIGELY